MDVQSFGSFEETSRAVIAFLHRRFGFDLWMVTRTEGDDWIVLQCEDHGYGVAPGSVLRWSDSFCSEMVKGNGPRIAPHSSDIPAYAAAPIGEQLNINAYVGLPIVRADGSLFGTLCAIDPSAQPESLTEELELIEMFGAMLSTILQAELEVAQETRRAEQVEAEALSDALTNLYNRKGWARLLAAEEERCGRYGHPAAVLIVDLDKLKQVNDTLGHAAGDELIARTANALRQAARSGDVIARLGGDEFGILSAECDREGGEALLKRVRAALEDGSIQASVGMAIRIPSSGLEAACITADQKMYEEKRSR